MKYLFITGTRADFGKLKGLINLVVNQLSHEVRIISTGMHSLPEFGNTRVEVETIFKNNVVLLEGQRFQEDMSLGFSRFLSNFTDYMNKQRPDVVVVHGDRFDALAAAISATNLGVHVVHIEGGEVSGTIDEAIRHSITKFSHIHMVKDHRSKGLVSQLGENPEFIFVTGSPEEDVLYSKDLPSLEDVRTRYEISFPDYCIFCFHPVTTEIEEIEKQIEGIIKFSEEINENIIWIYPNNDLGGTKIIESLQGISRSEVKFYESMRFEYYITLLKNAKMIVGNSSSGVREAPLLGTPCINIGTRQSGRVESRLIFDCHPSPDSLKRAYRKLVQLNKDQVSNTANIRKGSNTSKKIVDILNQLDLNKIPIQKKFYGK